MAGAAASVAAPGPAGERARFLTSNVGTVARRVLSLKQTSDRGALGWRPCGAGSVLTAASRDARKRNFRSRQVKRPLGRPPQDLPQSEKLDKKGHFRTPRAARELALGILYAAYVSGVHPLQVFQERLNQRLAVRGSFDKSLLDSFSHSPANFDENEPAKDEEELDALEKQQREEVEREADILTAPIQLVYNKFVLDFARRLVQAAANQWQAREIILAEVLPVMWKTNPVSVALPVCILHLAIAELEGLSGNPKVVVNEAVELTKRYCDGTSRRVVNGCLGTYIEKRQIKELTVSTDDRLAVAPELPVPVELGWNADYRDE